ncbi:MAG: hypothetical protein IPO40_13820 [Fibrobacteres bacterium]|nr:hypothetical protein [Fibrobacterota bacterium]
MKSWVLRWSVGLIASLQPAWAGVTTACPAGGVTLAVQSSRLPGTLTSIDLSMLVSSPQAGSDLFALALQPAPAFHGIISLQIEIKAVPSDPSLTCPDAYPMTGVGQGCWLQRQVVDGIALTGVDANVPGLWAGAPRGARWYTASQLARMPKRSAGEIAAASSPFHDLVSRLGSVPAGQVNLRFTVLCEGKEIASSALRGDYRPVERPVLLMPGGPVRSGYRSVGSAAPTFAWNGSLNGVDLRGSGAYRLSVWELAEGTSVEEMIARLPQRTLTTSNSVVGWPSSWPILEPGKRYVWRVDALKRGLADDWLPSEVFGFTLQNASPTIGLPGQFQGSAEQSELLRLLAALAGSHRPKVEGLLQSSLPDPYSLQLGGKAVDLERLRDLVRQVQLQKLKVEGVEISR